MRSTPVQELDTPALLVDLEIMECNLAKMAAFFRDKATKLRPHFKDHRVVAFATRQMEAGAIGITCARFWQAEALASHGIKSILLANEIAGERAIRRFAELSRQFPLVVAVDNAKVVADMARIARDTHAELNVVVDVDLGLKRCGVQPGEPAVALAKQIVASGLKFRGLMGYEGHLQPLPPGPDKDKVVTQAMEWLVGSKNRIEREGIPVETVSCGGTGDYQTAGQYPGITEIQAGSFLLMDSWYAPFAPDFKPALSVLASVISRTPGERVVVDAGVKAISGERGLPTIKGIAGLRLSALHAEHALIQILDGAAAPEVGNKIELAVQYHDGTLHLHHHMFGIRSKVVEEIFPIEHGAS
jgi:D-serine deaminase-like pyridoxal phosphate-dependent protein